jgi:pimeloyl-ACP methyl ester carboxylesterase
MSRYQHQQVKVADHEVHVVTSGDPRGAPYLFLHGWPQSWCAWHDVMKAAGDEAHCIAIDLPGIGASPGAVGSGRKKDLARVVHGLVRQLGLDGVTVVGHDAGGMVAYAYLRCYKDLARAVIVNTVIPGVDPWDAVLARPQIWHFAMHALPALPEILVQGHQLPYFAYFFDVLASDPAKITPERRAIYAGAYGSDAALRAGFDLYRAMEKDAEDNRHFAAGDACETPLLYLRGDRDPAGIDAYAQGFLAAGIRALETRVVAGSGHFVAEEAPGALWEVIHADQRVRKAA